MNKISGVYEIVNTVNGHRYIGSAVNLGKRKGQHWRDLRRRVARSAYLQNAWNMYGEEAFEFRPLLYCSPEYVRYYEQVCLDNLHWEYNISPTATSCLGVKHSEEVRLNMSKAHANKPSWNKGIHTGQVVWNKGKKDVYQESTLQLMSEAKLNCIPWNKGKTDVISDEARLRMSLVRIGTKASTETKDKQSKSLRQFYIDNPEKGIERSQRMIGHPTSEATKLRIQNGLLDFYAHTPKNGNYKPGGKLSADDIKIIRWANIEHEMSGASLSNIFGVAATNICYILRRDTWRNIPEFSGHNKEV